jgi:hypothetical protein
MVFTVTRRLEHTTLLEMLLHTANKSFQGTDEGFDHAANSKSVSELTSMIPDFQARSTAICQKFERMSKVASTPLDVLLPAWQVIQNQVGRVVINMLGGDWQTIMNGFVVNMIWDPADGRTLLIAMDDGSFSDATYPDFSPR